MKLTVLLFGVSTLVLGVFAQSGRAQYPEERALTSTNFRAPDFPDPANEPPRPGMTSPPSPDHNQPAASPQIDTPPQEEVPAAALWVNSPPLTLGRLYGKVVLIEFWEYTNINSLRTLEPNKKWYERYHPYGFEIVGVHDPEFDISRPATNVRAAVKRLGLPYPVFVDPDYKLWQAYHNDSWPSRFLVDSKGVVRYHRNGEGEEAGFEQAIQRLLLEAQPELKFPENYTIPPQADAYAPSCGAPTAEMYVGDWSGKGVLSNREGYRDGKTQAYELPAAVGDGQAAVSGKWETDKNGMIYHGKNSGGYHAPDKLEMRYHARELYAVINVSHGRPSTVYVQQDGKDLTADAKGADVKLDAQGHSYIEVREPRLYYLVQNPAFGAHTVTLTPTKSGLTIDSFTFGNNCQTAFPHL